VQNNRVRRIGVLLRMSPGLLVTNRLSANIPYFSICIPQYNRTDFLIEACRWYAHQTFDDFEVCISDDCSDDGKRSNLLDYLESSGCRYIYALTSSNLRFDANLRAAIALSQGKYLLLMGNDDKLRTQDTLAALHDDLERAGEAVAAIANYHELSTGTTFRRMRETAILGAGPRAAIAVFRNYSFVSGVILRGKEARCEATTELDGSEMYQMYLGTRLVARGGKFLAIDRVCIDKDLQIPGQDVDSYRRRPRVLDFAITKRLLPMGRLLEVVSYGLQPCVSRRELNSLLFRIAFRLYLFTYPFWGVEYRRVQSWSYACGVLLALNPNEITKNQRLSLFLRLLLWPIYLLSCAFALSVPLKLFDKLRPLLYSLAKRAN
jgi:glycosyltransferase involved in cell wall biosynthesis